MDYLNKIILGDSLATMRQMPSGSVNLVVTSPPYNLKNSTGNGMKAGTATGRWKNNPLQNGYTDHGDNMPHEEYVQWQRDVLSESMRLLTDDGAIFYNHKWRVQNGQIQDRADIMEGFPVRQIIIWKRAGGFNFNPGYFVPTYEVIYLIAKKKFLLADGGNALTDVWEFPQERKNEHPAPYPLELAERCIRSTNAEVILDPFMGSGTTAIAALKHGRKFVGCELSAQYKAMADQRIADFLAAPVQTDTAIEIEALNKRIKQDEANLRNAKKRLKQLMAMEETASDNPLDHVVARGEV